MTGSTPASAVSDARDEVAPASSPDLALSFEQVFVRFGDYVPALLRRLGVASRDVPDLAQEVFTVVYERLSAFRGESSLKTWICGIALRIASNHRRRAWVRKLVFFADFERHAAQLPAAQRDVFVLFEVEELPMLEAARLLGCAEKTAYTRLYAARRNIAKRLRRAGTPGRRS
jgi:RNA polymerase sigma-70 factor (ECF subfamily)